MTSSAAQRDDAPGHRPPRGTSPAQVTLDELTRPGGEVLTDRKGRLVVRHGDLVVKTHMAEEELQPLLARLRLAADPRLGDILLSPLRIRGGHGGLLAPVGGRLVSAWPAGRALRVDEVEARVEDAPWTAAAALLARLHATDLTALAPAHVPAAGVCTRLRRSLDRMEAAVARATRAGAASDASVREIERLADEVRRAYPTLPSWLGRTPARPGTAPALIHGDWHLGQVVRVASAPASAADAGWRIVDVDDLGWGDPAWDLARPAAWFAAGILPAEVWGTFLGAYREAGGPAAGPDGDPWEALDGPARAVAVQYAAGAVTDLATDGTPFDEGADAFVACARRMWSGH
ncbi:APH domain-containing protein [Frankia sp. Hr75.2]|nr:APH domain-containing protein [Frankia sp. Hr75.2]